MPRARTAHRTVLAASAAAICLVAAVAARAGEPPRGGRLIVTADPAVLSPGEGRVAVQVDGCESEPRVTASVGSVAGVRTLGAGRALADYVPPDEARPQVAIVAAVCGGLHGWMAIPIVGRGVAVARTEPGASIRVTIGTRSYGPAVAGADGEARVTVDVPPGVRFAYQGERPLDLRVPPSPHAHVVVDPPVLRADRDGEVRVLAFAVTEEGAPRAGAPLRLTASAGALGDLMEIEPGVALARWTLPAGPAGPVPLEARLADDPGPAAVVEVERSPGPPALVEAAPDRALAVAGEAPVQLDVTVRDAAGNLADAALRVEPPEVVLERRAYGRGTWAVGLEVPERLAGRAELAVVVGAGEAAAPARVALSAAPAATFAVEGAPGEVVADGRAAVAFRVALRDRFGNPALDAPPEASAGAAEVATVRDGDDFLVTVRPRRRRAEAEEVVTITAAGRTERFPLLLRAPEPALALAARAGVLASAGDPFSPYLGAEVSVRPTARLGAALEVGALALGRDDRASLPAAGGVDVRGEARWLPFVASLRWRAAPTARTFLVAGAGAALAALSAEVRVAGQPPVRERGRAAGAQLSFGAGRRFGAGALLVEARCLWLADPGLEVVRGRLLAAGLVAGWSHGVL